MSGDGASGGAFTGGSFSGQFSEIETRRSFLNALVGMRIADRYEIVRILGEGGMGVVTEARHLELEQHVAIKFMFPELISNEILNARFSREAKLAARVQSPHIVRVSDVGRLPSGVPYLVMDLLAGHDLGAELDAAVETQGTLPVERAVDYMLQACAGVAALHAVGVVHRDLKPSNLFVADIAGVPTIKVLDFGISKDITAPAASITSTETQLGTPMYMSPEQIRSSKNVDARSDVWSLGVILYELLTGTLPFERTGHSVGELFAVILMTEPMPLCMRRPELPAELEDVVMRCLRRNSWERHDSVAALAEALRPFVKQGAQHRVEAVRRALGDVTPSSELAAARSIAAVQPTVSAQVQPLTPSVSAASPPPTTKAAAPRALAASSAAAQTGDQALDEGAADVKLEVDYVPAPAKRKLPERQTSPSVVPSSRTSPSPGLGEGTPIRAGLVWGLGIAAAIVGAAATFAIRASSVSSSAAERTTVASPSDVATATAAPAPPPVVTPEPSPFPPDPTGAPAVPAQPVRTGARSPSTTPAVVPNVAQAHPSAKGTAAPSVAPVVTAAAPSAKPGPPRTEDLILDRK